MGQEATVVLLDHFGRVLDSIARLLKAAGLLQDVGRQNISEVVGPCGSRPLIAPRWV